MNIGLTNYLWFMWLSFSQGQSNGTGKRSDRTCSNFYDLLGI